MKVVGIIAEYNPFHRGHEYQIRYVRESLGADYVIVAMSGDFVQRGAPALMEKHLRAEMALLGGADLVLEMPVRVATASAEGFACGGVSLLDRLGIVDTLCFGSECGDTEALVKIAEILLSEPEAYRNALQKYLKDGLNFPAARASALKNYLAAFRCTDISADHAAEILSSPNNILGIEYCKALSRLKSSIQPHALMRAGSGYHETELSGNTLPSASAIRNFITEGHYETSDIASGLSGLIPDTSLSLFRKAVQCNAIVSESDLDLLLHYKLLLENAETLKKYEGLSDALIRRILKLRNQYRGFSPFADLLKTRDITRTAICRGLLHIFLNLTSSGTEPPALSCAHLKNSASYARVLGFRKDSSQLLRAIKEHSRIPVVTKSADAGRLLSQDAFSSFQETVEASNIYESVLCAKTGQPFQHEFEKKLRIL